MKGFSKPTIFGLTLGVFLAAYAAFAFTPPATTPPGGNTKAPVNVGATSQIKSGSLWVNSFGTDGGAVFGGNVGIGVPIPGETLSVGGVIESIVGGFKFPDGSVQTSAGGLKVYKADGTTLLGHVLGYKGAGGDICDGLIVLLLNGSIKTLATDDCASYPPITLWYGSAGCSPAASPRAQVASGSGTSCLPVGNRYINSGRIVGSTASCSIAGFIHESYKEAGGSCVNQSKNIWSQSFQDYGPIPYCGNGPCRVRL